jgi:hypothetical protein
MHILVIYSLLIAGHNAFETEKCLHLKLKLVISRCNFQQSGGQLTWQSGIQTAKSCAQINRVPFGRDKGHRGNRNMSHTAAQCSNNIMSHFLKMFSEIGNCLPSVSSGHGQKFICRAGSPNWFNLTPPVYKKLMCWSHFHELK